MVHDVNILLFDVVNSMRRITKYWTNINTTTSQKLIIIITAPKLNSSNIYPIAKKKQVMIKQSTQSTEE